MHNILASEDLSRVQQVINTEPHLLFVLNGKGQTPLDMCIEDGAAEEGDDNDSRATVELQEAPDHSDSDQSSKGLKPKAKKKSSFRSWPFSNDLRAVGSGTRDAASPPCPRRSNGRRR